MATPYVLNTWCVVYNTAVPARLLLHAAYSSCVFAVCTTWGDFSAPQPRSSRSPAAAVYHRFLHHYISLYNIVYTQTNTQHTTWFSIVAASDHHSAGRCSLTEGEEGVTGDRSVRSSVFGRLATRPQATRPHQGTRATPSRTSRHSLWFSTQTRRARNVSEQWRRNLVDGVINPLDCDVFVLFRAK